jgi:uncharacterized protein (TIGR02271 family)
VVEAEHKKLTSSPDQQQPSSSSITEWDSVIGKNVKTVDYQHAGRVIAAVDNEEAIIISSEGPHTGYNYRVHKRYIQGVNGPDLLLSIDRAELTDYEINDFHNYAAQLRSIKTEKKEGEEERVVPVIEEKLKVSKKVVTDEATIIKEPRTETKTIEVSLAHEELVIEKRPAASAADVNAELLESPPPRNTRTEIRIPLIHEAVKIKKVPYVREEIVIRKKPRTETKTVSEFVTKEKVDTKNNNNT